MKTAEVESASVWTPSVLDVDDTDYECSDDHSRPTAMLGVQTARHAHDELLNEILRMARHLADASSVGDSSPM